MIALSLFLGVMVAVAAAGVQITSVLARAELKQAVVGAMGKNLDALQSTGFEQLVGELYTAPSPCASRGVGRQTSCQAARGRSFTVRYQTELGVDPAAGAGTSASYVAITARSTLPDGTTVSATRRVPAPTLGFTGDTAVLRVRAAARDAADQLPVSLVDASGTAVLTGVPFVNDLAVLRVPGDACTGAAGPCRLALDTDAQYWRTAGYTLSPRDVLGANGRLELVPGSFTDVTAQIGPLGTATVHLVAQATDGTTAAPPAAARGSVCLWGSFPDGTKRRSVPFCNDTDPATITVASFTDPGSSTTYPLPAGFQLSLALDPPDGDCAAAGQYPNGAIRGTHDGGWWSSEVCTSWTWGTPSLWGPHGAAVPASLPQTLELAADATASYDLVWAPTRTGSKNWAQLAVGTTASCGITTAHTLYCWGPSAPGAGVANTPTQLGTDQDWSQVAVGADHACAVKRGGTLWCWGANARGQLGDGTTTTRGTPVQVGTQRYQAVATGNRSSCAIRQDSTLWCWGDNTTGQLGAPTSATGVASTPVATGAATVEALVLGPDGNLWATDSAARKILKYGPDGTLLGTYPATPLAGAPTRIVRGPDGNLWFVEPGEDRIGRVTPAGAVTEFAAVAGATTLSGPSDLAVGPDGALWFTPNGITGTLGRITTAGAVSSCAVQAGDRPFRIATGRSGALWYSTTNVAHLGRVKAPSCSTSVHTVTGIPRAVTLGPDGNVWFSTTTGRIGRVTDSGNVAQWAVGGTLATDLTAGADGNVWYGLATNRIGKIATSTSTSTDFTLTTGVALGAVTRDAAGDIWGTDPNGHRLVRLALYRPTPVQVGNAATWTQVTVGDRHACGLQGTVARCWGADDAGQAGVALPSSAAPTGVSPAVAAPTTVAGSWAQISAGLAHTCATGTDGTAACWGTNAASRLGTAAGTLGVTRRTGLGGTNARGVAVDATGAVWTALAGSDAVTRYDPATDSTTTYPLPAGSAPDGLAVTGSTVYVAEPGTARIAQIAVATGVVTQLIPPSTPAELAVDAGGALWYSTTGTTGKIGKLAGANFTEYTVASGACTATKDVALGPDGLVYAVSSGSGCAKLARITAGGAVEQVATLTTAPLDSGFAPVALEGGPSGLWVTSAQAVISRIARVTPAGAVSVFNAGNAGVAAASIHDVLEATDGRVWYTADGTVGVLDPAVPATVEYPVPGAGPLQSLAEATDGTVWVSEGPAAGLVRLPAGAATPRTLPGGAVWAQLAAGATHSCAIRTAGSLWCWGSNGQGQLGTGDTATATAPTRIGAGTSWVGVSAAVGANASCATTTGNAGSCWGQRTLTGGAAAAGYDTSPQALGTEQGTAGPATPATGNELVDPWTKPRALTYAWDATTNGFGNCVDENDATPCSSVAATATPEQFGNAPAGCATDPFCFSSDNAPPKLTDPVAPYGVRPVGQMTAGSMNAVGLTMTDPEGELLEFRVTATTAKGSLTRDPRGTTLVTNAWYPVSSGTPTQLGYTPAAGFPGLDTFTIELRERAGQPGHDAFDHSPTTVPVYLYSGVTPLTLTPASPTVQAAQGTDAVELPVTVVNSDGSAASGVTITAASAQATLAFARPSVTTDGSGVATFALAAGATPAGEYPIVFQATNGRTATAQLTVTPTATSVSLATSRSAQSTAELAQGGPPLTVTATVRDRAGATMAGQLVRLVVEDATGSPANAVRAAAGNCTTTGAGTCTTTLAAERTAPAGAYRLRASAASVATTTPLTVTATAATLAGSSGKAVEDAYAAAVEADSPTVWLRLDETAGTTAAATAGPAASYTGTVELGLDPLAGSGTAGAVGFQGGKVCTDTATALGATLALEAWVRPDASTGTTLVWGSSVAGAPRLSLAALAPRFELVGAGAVSGPPLAPGTAYHLVGVRAANRMELWVNGRLAAATTTVPVAADPTVTLCGGDDASLAPTTGVLDELAVYATALEPATITRHAAIGLATGAASGAGSVSLRQGGTAELVVTALDGTGAPAAGVSLSAQLAGGGVSVTGADTPTDDQGQTTLSLTALASADPGAVRRLTVTTDAVHLVLLVTVDAHAAGITVPDLTVRQGATATAAVTVADGATPANPVPGAIVRLTSDADAGLKLAARATTDAAGVAHATVAAAPDLPTGSYPVTVTSGGLSETFTVTVTTGVGRVFVEPGASVRSGASSTVHVAVRQADDSEVTGASVALSCLACGLSFGPSAATGGDGLAAITVTDAGGANPPGRYSLTATVDGEIYPVTLTVAARAAQLTALSATPVRVPRGGYALVSLRVTDDTTAANPVPAALVESTNELSSTLVALPTVTGPDGRATLLLIARAGATQPSYTLTLRTRSATGGWVTLALPVSVTAP